jgi:DNA helicase-2/ATP-dependent DNA helicase PcrA
MRAYPTAVTIALSPRQREAVDHPGGPLLIVGGPGSGKTTVLLERFARLVRDGHPPESILVIPFSAPAAEHLRARLEEKLTDPFEELVIAPFTELCGRLLREEGLHAGVDPFATPVTAADRLAMLLDRIDELPLARHDLGGNPTALLASLVGRIDRLKEELISAADYRAWAATLRRESEVERANAGREREFADLYTAHDRMLAEAGALDAGDLVMRTLRLLREQPHVRHRVAGRFGAVLVDELQDSSFAQGILLRLLVGGHANVCAAGDPGQAIHRFRGAAEKNFDDFRAEWPTATTVHLDRSLRVPENIGRAAQSVVAAETGPWQPLEEAPGSVAFWRCASERGQAQAVAADVERALSREGADPEEICILVRSVKDEGQAIAVALEERAVPFRVVGAAAFFERAEVRDLLAWLRLLSDPGDAGAVVRALARAPVELRSIDIARCTQIARRRKLDMVAALGAALESPQVPPEARDRIAFFLKLHRSAAEPLDSMRPDAYVHRLVELLGLRRQLLFAASTEVVERLVNLAKFSELAAAYVRRAPQSTAREFARSIAAVAEAGLQEEEASAQDRPRGVQLMGVEAAKGLEFDSVYVLGMTAARMPGTWRPASEPIPDALIKEELPSAGVEAHLAEMRRLLYVAMTRARRRLVVAYPESAAASAGRPSPFVEEAREAVDGAWEPRQEELFGPAETLQSTFRLLRDELLTTVAQVGGRLGELRFDTDLDVSHAVVRYLELIKLSALLESTRADPSLAVADLLPDINARLLQAATSEQREILATSALDEYLLDAQRDEKLRARAVAARAEPSLESFLPRRGDGLLLSASDIETYRTCPLKYKFARVFRIPQEPTINQRFGILVHQVLERFHGATAPGQAPPSLRDMLDLLEAGWRRGGFGDSEEERQLRSKASRALIRYHERFRDETGEPVWFERSFSFRMGPHLLRGRVDRVDRLADGSYELIDYKTGRPRTAAQLADDVQLSLYAVGARQAWQLEAAQQSYYYVLDDEKVPVDRSAQDQEWIEDTVREVAEGIESQGFEPTPSWSACSMCDYRIACPAAER